MEETEETEETMKKMFKEKRSGKGTVKDAQLTIHLLNNLICTPHPVQARSGKGKGDAIRAGLNQLGSCKPSNQEPKNSLGRPTVERLQPAGYQGRDHGTTNDYQLWIRCEGVCCALKTCGEEKKRT